MRTARFIGSWISALVALTIAIVLLTQWVQFVIGLAGATASVVLFFAIAYGVNVTSWSFVGLLRLGDNALRPWRERRHARRAASTRSRDGDDPGEEARVRNRARQPAMAGSRTGGGGGGGPDAGADPNMTSTVPLPLALPDNETTGPHPVAASRSAEDTKVAVVIPAHNEEPVIGAAIQSALRLFNRWDIYVVSDSSADSTADIAAETGVNVLELLSNRGKAGAIQAVIDEFDLTGGYDAVVILDADTELEENYVTNVKRHLTDPSVAAVAGFVVTRWNPEERTIAGRIIAAYRDRLYVLLQYLMRWGQSWRFTNCTFIVPGFASTYRTSALKHIDIDPKGLVIEDFNMTFDLQRKRLGRIAFHPDTRAYSQDPFTFGDYYRQVRRWTLGFWQTVRRHGVWPSLFWFALFFYILEILIVSVMLLAVAVAGAYTVLPALTGGMVMNIGWYAAGYDAITFFVPASVILVALIVPDYIVTCVLAAIRRRPSYLIYGLFFLPLRLLDAALSLRTLPEAWTINSDGRWKSPDRAAAKL